MRLGYYYAEPEGRYGSHFDAQSAHTDLYRASLTGVWGMENMVVRAAENTRVAMDAGKAVWLALDMPNENGGEETPWREHLEAQLALGANVVAIELTDEPRWGPGKARRTAVEVRAALDGRLSDVPLGVTLSRNDVLAGGALQYGAESGYGYVAAEAYLDPRRDWGVQEAEQESYTLVKKLWRKCPRSVEFWVVGMSYSLTFDFGPVAALKAVQRGTYQGAAEKNAAALCWFSYGRPSGVVTYPKLAKEHKAIAKAEGVIR